MLFTTPPKDPIYQQVISIVQKKEEPTKPLPYVVQPGDSLSTIADLHSSSVARLWAANTQLTNPDQLTPGDPLNVPQNTDVLADRPMPAIVEERTHPSATQSSPQIISTTGGFSYGTGTGGNTYYAGQCVWYIKNIVPWVENGWGNGNDWVYRSGHRVSSVPAVGTVASAVAYNHVALVTAVGDGTVTVSEMNYNGPYAIDSRVAPVSEFQYIYP